MGETSSKSPRSPREAYFFSTSGGGLLDEVQTDTTVPCARPGHEAMRVFRPQLRDDSNFHPLELRLLLFRLGRKHSVIEGRILLQKEVTQIDFQGIDGRNLDGASSSKQYVFIAV